MPAPAWMYPFFPSTSRVRMAMQRSQVAGVVGVEDGAAVDAAAGGLQFLDDLHGADFGRAGERSGGEAGAEGVDGGELRAELPSIVADQVHDVRVALDVHEICHLDGAVFADAADVVAAEVDEHDVLGAFLLVGGASRARRRGRLLRSRRAGGCRRWGGTRSRPAFDADEQLGRGADDVGGLTPRSLCGAAALLPTRSCGEAQEVHIRRRVDDAQGAVDGEGIDAGLDSRGAGRGRPGRCRRRRCSLWRARRL